MKTSVIVATYNRPRYLKLSVMSLAAGTILPSEVLIADDGSTSETHDAINELRESLRQAFPLIHVRQEHTGCRKQKIVNEAVRQSTGDYLIFIDGDCIVHREFMQAHVTMNDPDAILAGQRVQIGKELTEDILAHQLLMNRMTPTMLLDFMRRKSHHSQESIVVKNALLRKLFRKDRVKSANSVIGCNCSLYKKLFLDINGYDEDFCGFGDEDADLGVRILNQGKKITSVRNLAIVFHLYHTGTWSMTTDQFKINAEIKRRRIENREAVCRNGISKLD